MPSPFWLIALLPPLAAGALLFCRGRLLKLSPKWRRMLSHGQWPKFYAWQHGAFILAFPALMLSGTALYFEAWHRLLIAWLPKLENFHSWLGLAMAALMLLALLGIPAAPKRPRWVDWLVTGCLSLIVTLTGIALWQPQLVPRSWDAIAFSVHGWVSYAWLAWILFHAGLRLASFQAKNPLNARFSYQRRGMVMGGTSLAFLNAGFLTMLGHRQEALAENAATATANAEAPTANNPAIPRFPAYYSFTNSYPDIKPADYRLTLEGLVTKRLVLNLNQVQQLDATIARRNFVCVTGWSVPDVAWTGVSLPTLLALVGARPEATHMIFYSADGVYVDQLSLQDAMQPGIMLAYLINGQPLLREGGYPVRLIVPPMYGYKSVKWVNRVVLAAAPITGTWERYGYADQAWI